MDDSTKKEILGSLIKSEREKQNYTQDKFSSLIDIAPRNLSKIEKGKSFPSFGTFCRIVEVLKIEPNYFFNFIQFDSVSKNELDIELFEIIKSLPNNLKNKIIEIIKLIKN